MKKNKSKEWFTYAHFLRCHYFQNKPLRYLITNPLPNEYRIDDEKNYDDWLNDDPNNSFITIDEKDQTFNGDNKIEHEYYLAIIKAIKKSSSTHIDKINKNKNSEENIKEKNNFVFIPRNESIEIRFKKTIRAIRNKEVDVIINPVFNSELFSSSPLYYDKVDREIGYAKNSTYTNKFDYLKSYFEISNYQKTALIKNLNPYLLNVSILIINTLTDKSKNKIIFEKIYTAGTTATKTIVPSRFKDWNKPESWKQKKQFEFQTNQILFVTRKNKNYVPGVMLVEEEDGSFQEHFDEPKNYETVDVRKESIINFLNFSERERHNPRDGEFISFKPYGVTDIINRVWTKDKIQKDIDYIKNYVLTFHRAEELIIISKSIKNFESNLKLTKDEIKSEWGNPYKLELLYKEVPIAIKFNQRYFAQAHYQNEIEEKLNEYKEFADKFKNGYGFNKKLDRDYEFDQFEKWIEDKKYVWFNFVAFTAPISPFDGVNPNTFIPYGIVFKQILRNESFDTDFYDTDSYIIDPKDMNVHHFTHILDLLSKYARNDAISYACFGKSYNEALIKQINKIIQSSDEFNEAQKKHYDSVTYKIRMNLIDLKYFFSNNRRDIQVPVFIDSLKLMSSVWLIVSSILEKVDQFEVFKDNKELSDWITDYKKIEFINPADLAKNAEDRFSDKLSDTDWENYKKLNLQYLEHYLLSMYLIYLFVQRLYVEEYQI